MPSVRLATLTSPFSLDLAFENVLWDVWLRSIDMNRTLVFSLFTVLILDSTLLRLDAMVSKR